jgi:hypothetical protein
MGRKERGNGNKKGEASRGETNNRAVTPPTTRRTAAAQPPHNRRTTAAQPPHNRRTTAMPCRDSRRQRRPKAKAPRGTITSHTARVAVVCTRQNDYHRQHYTNHGTLRQQAARGRGGRHRLGHRPGLGVHDLERGQELDVVQGAVAVVVQALKHHVRLSRHAHRTTKQQQQHTLSEQKQRRTSRGEKTAPTAAIRARVRGWGQLFRSKHLRVGDGHAGEARKSPETCAKFFH